MTDEELIKHLRLSSYKSPTLAADRIEQLVKERDALQAELDAAADRVKKITLDDAGKLPPDTLGVWVLALETAHKAVLDELKVKE